jgi:hypothetical protein
MSCRDGDLLFISPAVSGGIWAEGRISGGSSLRGFAPQTPQDLSQFSSRVDDFWLPTIAVATKGISGRRKQFWRGGQIPVRFFFIEVT